MSDKHITLERIGYTDSQSAEMLFPHILAKRFWCGVVVGALFMAMLDLTDMHICIGECDGAGYDIVGTK